VPEEPSNASEEQRTSSSASPSQASDAVVLREADAPLDVDQRMAELVQEQATPEEAASVIETLPPPDAADTLEELEPEDSARILDAMEAERAAEALAEMERPLAASILQHDLEASEAAEILAQMEPDEAVDLLQSLPQPRAEAILRAMPRRKARALRALTRYDPETAGGVMTTDFLRLQEAWTVGQAREAIRQHPDEIEYLDLYCVDEEGRLVGAVNIKSLLLARSGQPLRDVMERELVVLKPEQDREEVARIFDRYDYLTLPVVDEDRHLLGVVTIDDVLDIIRQENTEDAYKQVGAGPGEAVYSPIAKKVRSRLPWLTVNLITGSLGAVVISRFEPLIANVAFLAVLMPMIANQAGNAGQQSLAVTLRGLVLGEVRRGRIAPLLAREAALGAISGAIAGALLGLIVAGLGLGGLIDVPWQLGFVVAAAMTGALTVGCLVGAGIPLVMQRLGQDPATASTIFLTMLTDASSFFTFLGLAAAMHDVLGLPASAA